MVSTRKGNQATTHAMFSSKEQSNAYSHYNLQRNCNSNPNGTAKSKSDNVIATPLQLGSAGYWLMLLLVDITTDLELGVLHNSCPTPLKLEEFLASCLQLDQRPSVSAYNIVCMRAQLRVRRSVMYKAVDWWLKHSNLRKHSFPCYKVYL